jgi:hypothetical protein
LPQSGGLPKVTEEEQNRTGKPRNFFASVSAISGILAAGAAAGKIFPFSFLLLRLVEICSVD